MPRVLYAPIFARFRGLARLYAPTGAFLLSLALQEGIVLALFADGGLRTVAGRDDGFIRQGEQLVVQGLDDLLERTSGQVGPANASRKKRIAGDQFLLDGEIKADASFGMAWSEKHICQASEPAVTVSACPML